MSIQQGVYRHYKGGLYTVLFSAVSANNADDRDDMVVYISHTTGQAYTRKSREFFGKSGGVNRFEFVASTIGPPIKITTEEE